MDGTDGMVLWVLAGAGVTLIYSAIKHKSPLSVLTNHLAAPSNSSPSSSSDAGTTAPTGTVAPASEGKPYSVGKAPDGTMYVYDGNGSPISVLPANYASSPSTYIPSEY